MSNQVRVSRTTTEDKKRVFMVQSGEVGIQLTELQAYHVASMIASLCGCKFQITENGNIDTEKVANENSTKEKPLGV